MRKDPRAITIMSDDKDLMAALPDKDTAKLSINVAFTLSQFDKDEVRITRVAIALQLG